jgi:hypothetical protein
MKEVIEKMKEGTDKNVKKVKNNKMNKIKPNEKKSFKVKDNKELKDVKSSTDNSEDEVANEVVAEVAPKVVVVEKRRDFGTDLIGYISSWNYRESAPWKFNKILQTWALDNCYDKKKIDTSLFKVS